MSDTAKKPGWFGRLDNRDEREFLPAALEILETPPSPLGRGVAITIMALFLIAIVWALLGKVDVNATASGRLEPSGKVKVVQPLDFGTVRAIHVQDGDHVQAGQVLIELDPTDTGADRDRLAHDLVRAELDVARLTALKQGIEHGGGVGSFVAPADASSLQIEEARTAMKAQADEQASKIANITQQISQKQAEAEEVAGTTAKLKASLPLVEQKTRLHQQLRDKGFGTSFALLDAQQQLSETRHEILVQSDRAAQALASQTALERARDATVSEFATHVLEDLSKAEQQRSELTQELVKAQRKSTDTTLRAPISGVVEQLAIHTVGGVVTPAQHLLVVVPGDQALTVEASLPNRDVGFVHAGQDAQVKVETFSFTRYGLIHGRVIGVSRDTSADERGQDPSQPQPAQTPVQPPQSPTYTVRIALDRSAMMVDGKLQPLAPGMAVTAEIRTGRRTIIDYLFSPLAKRANESLHER